MRAAQEAYLEWMDYMEEEQIKDLRTEIKYGVECPVCGDTGTIDGGGSPTPETGTTTERPCPLCGPVFTKCAEAGNEPAPF